VEFLASVPACYKIHDGWTKFLARKSMVNRLPNEIVWRRDKMGWPVPEEFWFRGPLKDWFCQTILNSRFLRHMNVGYDIKQRIETTEPIGPLVRLLNLAVWHEIFFESTKR